MAQNEERILSSQKGVDDVSSRFYTDNPLADFERWDSEQAEQIAKLPVCEYCGEPIQDEHFYLINDEVICKECLNAHFRKFVDEYIE